MGTYKLDGVNLTDAAGRFWLDMKTGVRVFPGVRRSGMVLPGRDGVESGLSPTFEPSQVALSLIVTGASNTAFMANLEFLYGLLGQRNRLLPLEHEVDAAAADRHADVQIKTVSEPEVINTRTARITVVMECPGVFWRAQTSVDSSVTMTASTVTAALTNHAGTTGTITDAIIRVKGAISGATITDPVSGHSITLTGALTATEYVIITCDDWSVRKVISDTWNRFSAGSSDYTAFTTTRGQGPMLTLSPDFSTGAARVQITTVATSPTSSPTVEVRAKRSFI